MAIDPKKIAEWKVAVFLAMHGEDQVESTNELGITAREAIPDLLAERAEMLALLRDVEWSDRDHVQRRCCRFCGEYAPEGDRDDSLGHALDCRLAAFLKGP
jgi:hypothetical protein